MRIIKTKFKDLYILQTKTYKDKRGYFKEILKESLLKKKFPFIVMSKSKKNILRGLHVQMKNQQGKFISVLKGKVFDVALDLRPKSKTFGKFFSITLSEKNSTSIFIPPGFAHGFYTLEKDNYILYSCTNYRHANSEVSIKWNDKKLKINWPCKRPVISNKDKNSISFDYYIKNYI
ncbi:dTDP-4-dehydrorhamnose 3,5-epimerase [Candidatus Pelagibacter sp.]|nr:dTDP-4-dehydrorhamnose 3,5-epimerase [Candidatus Pelagibacter sp.]MDA9663305.1 dTDP-4-dehydrorhamnose 3,5-epimerase [Candidatus Pelagibacter sp.]